jgi:protein-S-isoprenylcysteine O-methyltransferase Ste14
MGAADRTRVDEHRHFVRVAWCELRSRTFEDALPRIQGACPGARHATLTLAWSRLVHEVVARSGADASFEAFAARHPELLDPDRVLRHYSRERLEAARARREFVLPDLAPLPSLPARASVRHRCERGKDAVTPGTEASTRPLGITTTRRTRSMNRFAALIYGVVCYAVFFSTFLYAAGFLANFVVPKSIDSGSAGPAGLAVVVNLALLSVFAVQHSVMARIGFKRWWTRFVPQPVERATYVLASSLAMILLFAAWQPLPGVVYSIQGELARAIATGVFALGLSIVLYSTFLIDHFDLFGLRQVVLYFRGMPYTDKKFVTPSLYKHIRHPLYVGWFITFWATPDMTVGHLLMAGVVSAYILVAIVFEERDLTTLLGNEYRAYRERTPLFIPRPGRKDRPGAMTPAASA